MGRLNISKALTQDCDASALADHVISKIDTTIKFTNTRLTRRARTSLWEPKKGKTRNISFFGTVAIGYADLFFCLFKT